MNLTTGKTKPFIRNLATAKGLVYLDAAGLEPVLSLSGTTPGATNPTGSQASKPIVLAAAKGHGDSDALAIVLSIVALVTALGFGGVGFARRGRAVT